MRKIYDHLPVVVVGVSQCRRGQTGAGASCVRRELVVKGIFRGDAVSIASLGEGVGVS